MSLYPALNVISTPSTLYLTTGPHLHSFNALDSSFSPLASTSSLPESDVHKGLIRLVAVSKDGNWLASVADDKLLKVWEVKDGGKEIKLDSSRQALKKISTLEFLANNDIVIGDRLGDAFTYPLHPVADSTDVANTERKVDLHADPALNPDGKLILGHTSPITSLFLTSDEKYIVTSDRDEHIRISRYPEGEIVERFLLGSKHFISTLLLLSAPHSLLLSAGGDASLNVWSFSSPTTASGSILHRIPILDVVKPFIKIEAPKRYGRANEKGEKPERTPGSDGLCVLKVLEVGGRVVFFSLGATALFSLSLDNISSISTVEALNLRHPILDFAVLTSSSSPTLLVSLDIPEATTPALVTVEVSSTALSLLPPTTTNPIASLLTSSHLLASPPPPPAPIQKKSNKTKAPRADGKPSGPGFNLYQLLVELPKWSKEGEEEDGAGGGEGEDVEQISKKESGRRKNNGGIPSLPHLGSGNVHPHQQQRPSSSSSAAEAGHVGSAAEGRKSNKRRFLVVAAANAKPEAPVEEDEAMEVGGKEELEAEGEGEEMVVEEDEEAVGNM